MPDILMTFKGTREVTLVRRRPTGRAPRQGTRSSSEARFSVYLDAKTEYAWFRRKKHAEMFFIMARELLAETPKANQFYRDMNGKLCERR